MERKLDQLVNQIYEEGIEKAKKEKESILEQARAEAESIVNRARAEARALKSAAEEESRLLAEGARTEVRLAVDRAQAELKRQLETILEQKILPEGSLKLDGPFLQALLLEAVRGFKAGSQVTLSDTMEEEWRSRIKASIQSALPVDVEFSPGQKSGFSIKQAGENYRLDFSAEALENFLRSFLKATTRSLLFSR
ncbi:MAG: hypothetical protein HS115_18395 [Spirochaetales bacterium]|nr:hypothetical protein [Spirochaetales bacterium]